MAALSRAGAGREPGGRLRTGRFRALGHDFAVRTPDARLTRYLEDVFGLLAAPGEPCADYVVRRARARRAPRWETWYGAERVTVTGEASMALAMLLWHVNHEAVARTPGLVRVHAAVASLHGDAVLLAAPMESGKTTLVAGLVRAGLDYLSDEVAALEPDTLTVQAYPKALSVDPGSWSALADFAPHVDPGVAAWLPDQWQLPATAIRPGAVTATAQPRVLIFPRYEAGAATRLAPLSRADAVVRLVHSTFRFAEQPDRDLEALGRLARDCECHELVMGDLDAACERVLDALASPQRV